MALLKESDTVEGAMKKVLGILTFCFVFLGTAKSQIVSNLTLCMNPSGQLITMAVPALGAAQVSAARVQLLGVGPDSKQYAIQCDANGVLLVSGAPFPGWNCVGSGVSQVCTAPGNIVASGLLNACDVKTSPTGQFIANTCTGTGNSVLATSPTFAGSPSAPTPAPLENSTILANTVFVRTGTNPTNIPVGGGRFGSVASPVAMDLNFVGAYGLPRAQIESLDQTVNNYAGSLILSTSQNVNTGLLFTITNPGVYTVVPTSITFAGFSFTPGTATTVTASLVGSGVAIARQTTGSGYSGTGTCAVNGGTFTVQATCTAVITPVMLPALSIDSSQVVTIPNKLSVGGGPAVSSIALPSVSSWLQYLATGLDGSYTATNTTNAGIRYYTNFTVPFGVTLTVGAYNGLTIHATGTCTIAGTINARGMDYITSFGESYGAAGGGSGGGAAAGAAGMAPVYNINWEWATASTGGTAGAAGGGAGGNGTVTSVARFAFTGGGLADGQFLGGGTGRQGGSTGGALGNGGVGVTLICGSIVGTDGTHTGIIDVSGGYGSPAAANSTGSGSGGGAGVVILSSMTPVTTWPTVITAPGSGAGAGTTTSTVPEALGYGGQNVTVQPVMTLGVTGGALDGTCTVVVPGATSPSSGSVAPFNWNSVILGGGGTLGGATVNTVWSAGSVASCTVNPGTSSGMTAATYTTSGTGGNGGAGWYAEFANGVQVH